MFHCVLMTMCPRKFLALPPVLKFLCTMLADHEVCVPTQHGNEAKYKSGCVETKNYMITRNIISLEYYNE